MVERRLYSRLLSSSLVVQVVLVVLLIQLVAAVRGVRVGVEVAVQEFPLLLLPRASSSSLEVQVVPVYLLVVQDAEVNLVVGLQLVTLVEEVVEDEVGPAVGLS